MIKLEIEDGKINVDLYGSEDQLIFLCMMAMIENKKLREIIIKSLNNIEVMQVGEVEKSNCGIQN